MEMFYDIIAVIVLIGIATLVIVGVVALCVQMITGCSLDSFIYERKVRRGDYENTKWYDIGRYCERYGAKVYKYGGSVLDGYVLEHSNGKKERFFMSALMNEVRYSLDNEKRAGD